MATDDSPGGEAKLFIVQIKLLDKDWANYSGSITREEADEFVRRNTSDVPGAATWRIREAP